MTAKQSSARLAFYCLAAFLTPIGSNWDAMSDASLYEWGGLLVQATISLAIAARAYVDTTPTRIEQP